MSTPDEPVASVLLCDAAQVVGGKLYILGGGWAQIWPPEPGAPTPMALAIHLAVPWSMTNERLNIEIRLVDEDGGVVEQEFGEVRTAGVVEAGRPARARRGMPISVPIVIAQPLLRLPHGGYVWEVEVNTRVLARAPFQVIAPPGER